MPILLLLSSGLALALLFLHSWRTRGKPVTLAFFISATVFGIVRGNGIWLLMKFLNEGSGEVLKPYLPADSLIPPIGHESVQVAVGWVFTLYLSWTLAELILRRVPRFADRVFMIAGVASLVVLAICWCMEATAVAVGWWYWTLPTRTALFGPVNVPAMEGWFTIIPDFLIPFLVIACSRARGKLRNWLWLLAFPLHLLGHLTYRWFEHAHVVYNLMELLVVALMMFHPLRLQRGEIRTAPGDRLSGPIFAVALAIFLGVIVVSDLSMPGEATMALTVLPMVMLCLLAWERIPVRVVLVLSILSAGAWVGLGPPALWALAPIALFGFLRGLERSGEPRALRYAPVAAVVVLSILGLMAFQADKARAASYLQAWADGDRLLAAGRTGDAEAAYRRAESLRPADPVLLYDLVKEMSGKAAGSVGDAAATFERRLPRMVTEMEEIARRAPDWVPLRKDLVRFYTLQGRIAEAAEQYRQMRRYRRDDADIAAMLAYYLLRTGRTDEAEQICLPLAGSPKPQVQALVNLGVIRFSQGREAEARALWEQALRIDPNQPLARVNLARRGETEFDRRIDLRFLAPVPSGQQTAAWTNNLAQAGKSYRTEDRIRLSAEATQLDPTYAKAHMRLAAFYVEVPSPEHYELAVWHARRAVELVQEQGPASDLPLSLLVLGHTLIEAGRPDEARPVIAEGKAKASATLVPQFQGLEEKLAGR